MSDNDLSDIGFQDTELFELPSVQDSEGLELKERAVKELKKSAIKQEIKTGEKPEWAEDVQRAEETPGAPTAAGPGTETARDQGEGPDGDDDRVVDDGDVPGGEDHNGRAPDGDGDGTPVEGLLEQFYGDFFKLLAWWTEWPGWRNTAEMNELYARNTRYIVKWIDPRVIGFIMLSVVTLGKLLGFKEHREREKAKKAGTANAEKAHEAVEAAKEGSQA